MDQPQQFNLHQQVLVSSKDKTTLLKQSGVIHKIKCKDCDSLHMGESSRKLENRLAERTSKAASSKSAIREHIERIKGYIIDWNNVKVVAKGTKRKMEAIHIKTLNR